MTHRIAITPGEPAGIGPDLCIAIAQNPPSDVELVIVSDPKLLTDRAAQLGLPLKLKTFEAATEPAETKAGQLTVLPIQLRASAAAGILDKANADYVLETLRIAAQTVSEGNCDAMVTGPVHKGIINDAGIPFSGHTEYLAEFCKQDLTVMMLATEGLRVALATTHLPLSAVPSAITKNLKALIALPNFKLCISNLSPAMQLHYLFHLWNLPAQQVAPNIMDNRSHDRLVQDLVSDVDFPFLQKIARHPFLPACPNR